MLAVAVRAANAPPLDQSPEEHLAHEIKAAFLYQFGSYVEWPEGTFEDERTPLRIGIMGDDYIAAPLEDIVAYRTVRGRPVTMRRMKQADDPRSVHILFIGNDIDPAVARAALDRAHRHPVLTVTESEEVDDAVISFVIDQDRVRFDVSLVLAEKCGLRISSRLLSVARRVDEGSS